MALSVCSLGGIMLIAIAVNAVDPVPPTIVNGFLRYSGPISHTDSVFTVVFATDNESSRLQVDVDQLKLSTYDYVQLRDGQNEDGDLLAQFGSESDSSDQQSGGLLFTSSHYLFLSFVPRENATTATAPFIFNLTELYQGGLYKDAGNVTFDRQMHNMSKVFYLMEATNKSLHIRFLPSATTFPNDNTGLITCYDGASTDADIVGVYRSDFVVYHSYSFVGTRLLCVGENMINFTFGFDTFIQGSRMRGKFSSAASDQCTMVSDPGNGKTAHWRIFPQIQGRDVIELTIQSLTLPPASENCGTSMAEVRSLQGDLITNLANVTTFPYILYADANSTGVWISSNQTNDNRMFPLGSCLLSITASYVLDSYIEEVTAPEGSVQTAFYPRGIPQDLIKAWRFPIAPKKVAALYFDRLFGINTEGFIAVYTYGSNDTKERVFTLYGNDSTGVPDDVYIPNPSTNATLEFAVYFNNFGKMSDLPGFKIDYFLNQDDATALNYNSTSEIPPLIYDPQANDAIDAGEQLRLTWEVKVPRENAQGNLNSFNMSIDFQPNNLSTLLDIVDGGKILYSTKKTVSQEYLKAISTNVASSSNQVLVYYVFTNNGTGNATGAPFNINFIVSSCDVCNVSMNDGVVETCLLASWRCDGVYQCRDGKDEVGCGAPPTSKPEPSSPSTGIHQWQLAVGIIFAFIGGIIVAILAAVCYAKRGRSYSRLRETLAPVRA